MPSAADFASWPRLGAGKGTLDLGPIRMGFEGLHPEGAASLKRWAGRDFHADADPSGADVIVELSLADHPWFLEPRPHERARLRTWSELGAPAMASHHVAALADGDGQRALALLARPLDAGALDRALQNLVRVLAAWRLVRSGRGLLLHASAVACPAGALLFVGPSGAGKSTAARLSAPRRVLADDVVVVERRDGEWLAHETALWAEPEWRAGAPAESRPVAAFVQLVHAPQPALAPLSRAAATARIAAHAPFLEGLPPDFSPLALAEAAAQAVRAARLELARDPSFWPLLDGFVTASPAPGGHA